MGLKEIKKALRDVAIIVGHLDNIVTKLLKIVIIIKLVIELLGA